MRRGGLIAAFVLCLAQAAQAQDVLVVDTDEVLANSLIGVQIEQRFEDAAKALVAENDRIEAELTAEEKALTEERATLEPEAFRAKADAFDEKVTRIRSEQDAKARDVQAIREQGREDLVQRLTEVLAQIARERGAVMVMERAQVFLSAESINVTDLAVRRLNANAPEAPKTPQDEGETPAPADEAAPN